MKLRKSIKNRDKDNAKFMTEEDELLGKYMPNMLRDPEFRQQIQQELPGEFSKALLSTLPEVG